MNILEETIFGPGNIHARCRVMALRIEGAEGRSIAPEAVARLCQALEQGVRPHILDFPAWRRLTRAGAEVPLAALVEVLALVTQRYTHWPVRFSSWRETPSASHPDRTDQLERQGIAVYEIGGELPGRAAGEAALALAGKLLETPSVEQIFKDFLSEMKVFLDRSARETPSGDALQIAAAAAQRGIFWSVLHRSQYLRLGLGRHSHILKGTESTYTASISRALSRDKGMTNRILAEAGLPVARQRVATRLERAEALAADIGFPLVVKPRDGNMGRGITVGLSEPGQLPRAFERAQKVSRHVVLESMLAGEEYRLLVVNGQFVAAAHRRAAQVRGDGVSTVAQLIEIENRRPEREPVLISRMAILRRLVLDADALDVLAEQGMTADTVPAAGQVTFLRRESNVSRGGDPRDVTDELHPDNALMAARAARTMGLDVCGVDFITLDPTVSWTQNGGAICEVNSRPGINMQIHLAGKQRGRITGPILDMYFPEGQPARVPVVALLGQPWQTRALRGMIEMAAAAAGRTLGLVGQGEAAVAATRKLEGIAALAWDNDIEIALIEAVPAEIVLQGIGVDRLDLALAAPSDGTEAHALAREVLARLSPGGVLGLEEAEAPARAAEALGLVLPEGMDAAVAPPPASVARRAADPDSFTALFLGDVGFGESYMHHPRTTDLQRILGSFGHGYSLANLGGILGLGHLNIANLEVPLSQRPDPALQGQKNYLGWCDPARTAAALQQAGIDAVTLANNHMLDCGVAGLTETLARLQQAGIASIGAGEGADAAIHPLIHRFRIGRAERALVVFPGFEHRRRYDRRYRWYARGARGGIGLLSPDEIGRQIAALRGVLPDPLFVAFPHWGTDYEDTTDGQCLTAAELVAAGVDLIIGHGAHILQPIEMIDGVPVLFNIGNFIWNTPGRFNKREVLPMGAAVSLTFRRGMRGGPRLRVYPLVTDNAVTGFQNRPVTCEEFDQAAALLTSRLGGRQKRDEDEAGFCLDLPLRSRAAAGEAAGRMAAE